MADISEQLKNARTVEDIVNLLMILFTNLNNQNEIYYDMFLNPVPMDLELERYDETGKLVTVTLPNVAKMKMSIYSGATNPNGVQTASQGAFYINTVNYDLYYKGYGSDSYGWILIWSSKNLDYLSPTGDASKLKNLNMASATLGTLAVERGGTGTSNITGLVKGNGTNPFSAAVPGVDYIDSNSMTGIICYYPIYDFNIPNCGIPDGWLRCDGYDGYLKTDYPKLASILGNKYGGTDTTFGVPNCLNRYIKCWDGSDNGAGITRNAEVGKHNHWLSGNTGVESAHTHDRGSMNITGRIDLYAGGSYNSNGALIYERTSWTNNPGGGDMLGTANIQLDASRSWSGRTGATSHSHSLSGATNYNSTSYSDENEVSHITMVAIIKY